jgi:Zn-dependent M16 (insulinase) family peptidase
MLQYLSDRMYDEVRGQGLTYGISMSGSVTEGRITLSLTRSSRLTEAYRTVREILHRYATQGDQWDETLADSAKGSIIYSWTEKEETVEDLVGQAVKAYMRKTDSKYNRQFVRALGRVRLADLKAAAARLLPAFLSADSSMTVVVCNPSTVEDVITDFTDFGIELTTYQDLEDTFLNEDS